MSEKSKFVSWLKRNEADIVLIIGIVLISLISFGGGWLMANNQLLKDSNFSNTKSGDEVAIEEIEFKKETKPIEVVSQKAEVAEKKENEPAAKEKVNSSSSSQQNDSSSAVGNKTTKSSSSNCKYVGSKNSDIYHLPECPGAKRIKDENLICFGSLSEAKKAGYRAAKNCPGL